MKNIFLISLLSIILNSCSKEQNNDPNLPVTAENLAGKWYFSKVIYEAGSTVTYESICATSRDFAEFFVYRKIETTNYYGDCVSSENHGCDYFSISSTNKITSCNPPFNDATVTQLTNDTMHLEYDELEDLGFMSSYHNVKGLIFTRQ